MLPVEVQEAQGFFCFGRRVAAGGQGYEGFYKRPRGVTMRLCVCVYIFYLYTLAISPSLGGSQQHKRQQNQWGPHSVPLAMTRDPAEFGWHCWSNTAHPPPSSTTSVASQMPSLLLPLPQGWPYKTTLWQQQMPIRTASQSFATHSYS